MKVVPVSVRVVKLIIPVVPEGVRLKLARADEQVKAINHKIEAYEPRMPNP